MKVIFLDIDGVLNHTQWYVDDRNPGNLNGQEGDIDPLCVERVFRIVNETGAKIVLSSDWKLSWPFARQRLEKAGFPEGLIIDKTPDLVMRVTDQRGLEIKSWLGQHKDCTNFCIIDDRTDFYEEQLPHFVHVDSFCGLTDDNADIAIMILNHH